MLYEDLERRGDTETLRRYREHIDAGIERLFDFVQENAEIAHLLDAPADTFDLAPAIESAVAAIAPESGKSISFTPARELPPVIGHRERFIMALANVLRNAVQARAEPPVAIHVTAGLHNGAAVFVQIDDDGPGVAPEDRTSIFSPGFSRRPGGSGQGLAFVREVVEGEMAGRITYEESPMGGARFVIRLPVGTRRGA
jgi:signal transduction histidine kinase